MLNKIKRAKESLKIIAAEEVKTLKIIKTQKIQKIKNQMIQGIIEILEIQEILKHLRNQEEALRKDRLQKIEEADNKKILHMNVN